MKYNFVIKLPRTNRLQNYNLTIRLGSRITALRELKEDLPEEVEMPLFILDRNAQVTVEYVDYLVARNFQDAVKGWIDGLKDSQHPKLVQYARRKSHYIPRITKYSIALLVLWLIISRMDVILPAISSELDDLAKVLIISLSLEFFAYNLASWLGETSMIALRRLQELSYLKLNKGDEREIERAIKENRYLKVKSILGLLSTLLMGVITKAIAGLLLR